MLRSLYSATSGMLAQQTHIDTTSNNIANVNTTGFKKSRADFNDLFYQAMQYAGTNTSNTTLSPDGMEVGLGVRPSAITKMFSQGSPKETENNLDVAITGKGFVQVQLPDFTPSYTRSGNFQLVAQVNLVTSDGYLLIPHFSLPDDTSLVNIGVDGTVILTQGLQTTSNVLGQITLANFVNPAGLHSMGDNLFSITNASGDAIVGNPDSQGLGKLRQGFLELSNVRLVEEMTDLITAQRAYEANSKSIQTADAMLQTVNSLKR